MSPNFNIYRKLDWTLIICWFLLVIFGWMNIFASVYDEESSRILSLSQRSGDQLVWIGIALTAAILIIFAIKPRFYIGLSWWFYIFIIILLGAVLVFGKTVNGSKSWLMIGSIGFQPSEISKITTSLCLAVTMGKYGFKLSNRLDFLKVAGIIVVPAALIMGQPDFGTVMVYCCFIFVLYREGLSGWYILFIGLIILLFILTLKFSPFVAILVLISILGITHGVLSKKPFSTILRYGLFITAMAFLPKLLAIEKVAAWNPLKAEYWLIIFTSIPFIFMLMRNFRKRTAYTGYLLLCYVCSVALIFSVDFIFDNVLKEHHRDRIENILGITEDLQGAGYNVNQSKIAIGSGGLIGKGFLKGTQTKFNFVPEQSTDFIFCTVGEEWGFAGSFFLLILFFTMITRIINIAEKNKDHLIRIYGYCVASCLFGHVVMNIGMTIGLFPVIGIPLPFISYGGTSFLSFTILLFIFIRLDLERWR